MSARKIIQFTAHDYGRSTQLHALCDDGTLWVNGVKGTWLLVDTSMITGKPAAPTVVARALSDAPPPPPPSASR